MLGLVTIGQSPRTDVHADVDGMLAGRRWVEHGALDALDAAAIAALAPVDGQLPLVSRLRDGGRATMTHASVEPLLHDAIAACAADGATAVLVMCSGSLRPIAASVPVYAAEPLAHGALAVALAGLSIGVVVPMSDQVAEAVDRWRGRLGATVHGVSADPYTASLEEIVAAGQAVAAAGVDAIVLDCFGYSVAMADAVRAATGCDARTVRIAAFEAAIAVVDGERLPRSAGG